MGKVILDTLLKNNDYQKKQIVIVSRGSKKKLALSYGVNFTDNPQIEKQDILFFSVPPQAASYWLQKIKLQKTNLLISIMAGYSIATIGKFHPEPLVIRAMPNLLIKKKQGLTAYFFVSHLPDEHKRVFFDIFQPISELLEVPQESDLDACTAVFGSGVGFVFYLMKTYFDAVKEMNFTKEQAKKITCNLFQNSSVFAQNAPDEFYELVNQVCTKGGTTEAGISVLKEKKLAKIMKECIIEAYKKSKKLHQG
jgi:pyrroline-5-carboxylate reductase